MTSEILLSDDVRRKAFYEKDLTFAGLFYVAVKTTGVFCRIGCPARAPRPGNIRFFETVKEALEAGFRPCKVCRPLSGVGEAPEEFRTVIDELRNNPGLHITNEDLARRGIQPDALRRWFKKHRGMTFQAYQWSLRIGNAVEKLKSGEQVTTVAFENYDSLSGFQESFKNTVGVSPRASVDKAVIFLTRIPTPLGLMMAASVRDELCFLEFLDREALPSEIKRLERMHDAVHVTAHCFLFDELKKQLDEYFAGERKAFTLPLNPAGTPFQKDVWKSLLTIPYGTTVSYLEQAWKIGHPEAVRAVAQANGRNPIAIIVPCHRVIGGNGKLTGYGGGLARKQWLLNHESRTTQGELL